MTFNNKTYGRVNTTTNDTNGRLCSIQLHQKGSLSIAGYDKLSQDPFLTDFVTKKRCGSADDGLLYGLGCVAEGAVGARICQSMLETKAICKITRA